MPIQNKSWFLQKPSFFCAVFAIGPLPVSSTFLVWLCLARFLPSGGAEAGLVGIGGWEVMNEMGVLLERGVYIVAASGDRSHFAQTQMQIIQELRASIFLYVFPIPCFIRSSPWCSLRRDPLSMNARFIIQQYWMDPVSQERESPDCFKLVPLCCGDWLSLWTII